MNYQLIKQFISSEMCAELESDLLAVSAKETNRWQGGRKLIPKTSALFLELCSESTAWRDLAARFEDPRFSYDMMDRLSIKSSNLKISSIYGLMAKRFSFFTRRASFPVRNSHPIFLLAWFTYSICTRSFVLGLSLLNLMRGKRLTELFYDASTAANGYRREVHRDSDSRVFVFLLYLNAPKRKGYSAGGELCLHALLDQSETPDPQPIASRVRTLAEIEPEAGCLVIFENNETSYHSVREMSGFDEERIFIYGSLTHLMGRASPFRGQSKTLPTDFKMYL